MFWIVLVCLCLQHTPLSSVLLLGLSSLFTFLPHSRSLSLFRSCFLFLSLTFRSFHRTSSILATLQALCLFAIDIHRFLPPFFLPFIHHRTTHVLLNEPFLSPFSWDLETVNFAYFSTKRTFHHIFSGHKISKVRVGYII